MTVSQIVMGMLFGIFIYYMILTVWYTALIIPTFPEVIRKFKESLLGNVVQLIDNQSLIPITILIPVFNEELRIDKTLDSIMYSTYKNIKIILINDGSIDNTMELLNKRLVLHRVPSSVKKEIDTCEIKAYYQSELFENIQVIDKVHSPFNCAADALNAGLNACVTPLVFTVDADTVLEPDAISQMLFTFFSNAHTVSVGGTVYVINDIKIDHGKVRETALSKRFIPAVQGVEYLRSFLFGRTGYNVLGGALGFPGAFTLFETNALRSVGGFDTVNFAYDAEIISRLHHWMGSQKYPHKIVHTPNAFCWTEVPATLKSYWRQRDLWQRGMLRTVTRHMGMLFNPKYGLTGMLGFPSYVFFEVMGPVVECLSYILFFVSVFLGLFSFYAFLWFLFLAWGYIALLSVAMVFLNSISFNKYSRVTDTLRVIWLAFAEIFGFRQLRALCCFTATLKFMFRRLVNKPI